MTDELGPSSRSLLDAAREGLSPDAAIAARVRAKVAATVGGVAAGAATSAATTTSTAGAAAATTTASSIVVKLTVVVLVAGAIVGGVVVATRGSTPPPAPAITSPASVDDTPRADVRVASPDVAPPSAGRPSAGRPSADRPNTDRPSTDRPAAGRPAVASLGREVELIDLASAAMLDHRPSDALAAIRTFGRETAGAGQLAQDAAAIEIEAMCELHADGIAAKLAAFDRRWPTSAQRSRLTTKCGR
jgi:hypothetical protein